MGNYSWTSYLYDILVGNSVMMEFARRTTAARLIIGNIKIEFPARC